MLYTRESGEAGGEAILFLHGGGLSSKSWLPVLERLPEFHCLAPDLPGHGESHDMPFSVQSSAEEAEEIIRRKAAGGKAHVVALSLSGPVALTLLRTSPERVDHAILSGSSGHFPRWVVELGKSTLWINRLFSRDYLVRATIKQQSIPAEYVDLLREDLYRSASPELMGPMLEELARWEPPQQVESPLLVVVGEKEPKASFGISRGYLKRYPNACGAVAVGMGHAWCLQAPDLFARMVRAWVTDEALAEGMEERLMVES